MAVDYWRPYLQTLEFTILTDQRRLIHLDDQRLHTYWQQKALSKLMGLQYRICYKKGANNNVADALSRVTREEQDELYSISIVQPIWLQELQESYASNDKAQELLVGLAVQPNQEHFQLLNGIVRQKGRVWLGHCTEMQTKVIKALHDSGALVTYQ